MQLTLLYHLTLTSTSANATLHMFQRCPARRSPQSNKAGGAEIRNRRKVGRLAWRMYFTKQRQSRVHASRRNHRTGLGKSKWGVFPIEPNGCSERPLGITDGAEGRNRRKEPGLAEKKTGCRERPSDQQRRFLPLTSADGTMGRVGKSVNRGISPMLPNGCTARPLGITDGAEVRS